MKTLPPLLVLGLVLGNGVVAQTASRSDSQDRIAIYKLRQSCAEEGRRWLKSNGLAVKPTDMYYSYKIHYSVKLNGCFVLQRNTVYDNNYKGPDIVPYRLVVNVSDIHADDSVANYTLSRRPDIGYFINNCQLPPDSKLFCRIHGKANGAPMDDRDPDITKEWADSIKPYMEE
jgi:hypothetical protein